MKVRVRGLLLFFAAITLAVIGLYFESPRAGMSSGLSNLVPLILFQFAGSGLGFAGLAEILNSTSIAELTRRFSRLKWWQQGVLAILIFCMVLLVALAILRALP